MSDSNPASTPLHPSTRLDTNISTATAPHPFPYREIIGSLNHAAVHTRPNICHAVSTLAKFSSRYSSVHCTAVKHLLRYVKGTIHRGITFGPSNDNDRRVIRAYADADYADDAVTRRSTTGYTICIGSSTVSWKSRRQRSVALSTTEAEYMSMGDCTKCILWFRKLMYVLSGSTNPIVINAVPTSIFNDNNGAVFLAQEAAVNSRFKHINIRHHFIRDLVRSNIIRPEQIDTTAIPADYLTKAAGKVVIDRCCVLTGNVTLHEAMTAYPPRNLSNS